MNKNEYIVLGCGRFGGSVAKILYENGYNVIGLDKDKQAIEICAKYLSYSVCANAINIKSLKEIGITNAKCIIVGVDKIEDSIMTCANLIHLGVKGIIIAIAKNIIHERVLKTLGIEHVIIPSFDAAGRASLQAMYHFSESMRSLEDGYSWTKLIISNSKCVNKPVSTLKLRERLNTTILYLIHDGKIEFPLKPNTCLSIGDTISIMTKDSQLGDAVKYFTDYNTDNKITPNKIIKKAKKENNGK